MGALLGDHLEQEMLRPQHCLVAYELVPASFAPWSSIVTRQLEEWHDQKGSWALCASGPGAPSRDHLSPSPVWTPACGIGIERLEHRACYQECAVEVLIIIVFWLYIPQDFELESLQLLLTTCESTSSSTWDLH